MKYNSTKSISFILISLIMLCSLVSAVSTTVDYTIRNGNPYEQQQITGWGSALQSILSQTIVDGKECSINPDITVIVEGVEDIIFPISDFPKVIVLYKYYTTKAWEKQISLELSANEDHSINLLDPNVKYVYEIYECKTGVSTGCEPSEWTVKECVDKSEGTALLVRTVQDVCLPASSYPKETTAFRTECYEKPPVPPVVPSVLSKSFTKEEMLTLSKSALGEGTCAVSSKCESRGEDYTDPTCVNPAQINEDIDLHWSDDIISFFKGSGICYVEEVDKESESILETIGNFIQDQGFGEDYEPKSVGIMAVVVLALVLVLLGGRK